MSALLFGMTCSQGPTEVCIQVVEVVCCKPSELQTSLYTHFLASNAAQRMLSTSNIKGKASALTAINALRKLCGHPKLIYDLINASTSGRAPAEADGFKVGDRLFLRASHV
jgi:DNA repair and recombination RAD54-like protein